MECGELRDYMSSIIKRTVASKLKSIVMYFVTLAIVLGGVSYVAPKFFGQVAHAIEPQILEVSKNGTDIVGCGSTSTPCLTIGYAISKANDGDTINIAEGTYIEQLTIGEDLTLIGAGEGKTIIQSPDTTLDSTFTATINSTVSPMKPIITIKGANVNISALKVDGNGKGDSVNNTFFVGIGFYNAGGFLDHVTVTGVKETPVSRDYQGDAVRATNADGLVRTLSITNSTISDFQKNGLVLSGSGLNVTVSGNTITGSGAIDLVAQNGIVLGTGITGSVTGNTVSELMCNDSTCGSDWYTKVQAIAIALVGAGSKTVSGNFVSNSDIGIYSELTSGVATITNNILTGNRWFGMLFEKGDVAVSGGSVTGGEIGIFNPSEHSSGNTTVHNVNISGNSIAGLKNDATSFSIDAINNWWGTAIASDIAAKITGTGAGAISYSPWCANINCTAFLPDTTAPLIELNGSSSMLLNNGESYIEPGATTNDGTLVTPTGSVNTSIAGVYTITYTATDAAGNVSIAYRTVTVKAADKPVVLTTTLGSSQVVGDEVAVADTTKEPAAKGEVKGTSDSKKEDAPWYDAAFMGLAWYWWVVLAIAAGGLGWWAFGAIRNRNQN